MVARRLQFHQVPDKVKDYVSSGLLSEFHLQEIVTLCAAHTLSPWLTTQQVWKELAEKAVHDRAKNGSKSRGKTRNEEILDLYLEGWNEAEIGRKIGHLKRSQIYNIIAESKKGINSQIGLPDPPQIGDVWLFTSCDDEYGLTTSRLVAKKRHHFCKHIYPESNPFLKISLNNIPGPLDFWYYLNYN